MPEWSLGAWSIIISTVVGVFTIAVSGIAVWKSHTANVIAREALKVQERGVDAAVSSEQRTRSADLYTRPPGLRQKRQIARFNVHNHGSSDAFDVELTLHHDGESMSFGKHERITAAGMWPFEQPVGRFLSQLDDSSELRLELRATYRDGTGPRVERWDVTITPGEQFANRRWTVEKLHDADQPDQG